MQLKFREIEKAFEIDENTLYQWLNVRGLPAVKANDQYYFNSVEVLEWALKNRIPLTPGTLKLSERTEDDRDIVTPALMDGGVHFAVKGSKREEVLGNILDLLSLPEHVEKAQMKEMLLAREQMGSTGVGSGIAIPHVKHPVVLAGMRPMIGLFFLENEVDFSAPDGKGVHTLFVILTSSFKGHLSLLARLAYCLQDKDMTEMLGRRAAREEIMAMFKVVESKIAKR
ncbi:MAG: PTS sugar transporter subunit IIA [Candidatus Omnitrophica bacterium]|nr:PTS sugar transporter subunit IIA [Candidatus Omnitrophota bacterium]